MGLEVGDGSEGAMGEVVRSEDPVVAPLSESLEGLDIGREEGNGHLTEEEASRIGQTGETPIEQAGGGSPVEAEVQDGCSSQSQTKKWSDFNAVVAKTFGEQGVYGSFSDFLADLPVDSAPQISGIAQVGSDVDFFEQGAIESDAFSLGGIGIGGMTFQPQAPAVAANQVALPDSEELAIATGSITHEQPALSSSGVEQISPSEQETYDQQQVQTWMDFPVQQGQTVEAEAEAEQSADPYPGWYYDYQIGEWRQVEGYTPGASAAAEASYTESAERSSKNDIDTSASQLEETHTHLEQAVQSQVGLDESQTWSTQSDCTQTITDQYPGWTWDYSAQQWVPLPGYNESWQNNAEQAQAYSEQQSWYVQQEQQIQTYNGQPHVASYSEQQNRTKQQPQTLYPGYRADSDNAIDTGYIPQSANIVDDGSLYGQGTQQWQGEVQARNAMAGGTAIANGDHGWTSAAFGNHEPSTSQSIPSNAYSLPDLYNSYSVTGAQNAFAQPAWGTAAQYNNYPQSTNPTAPPPQNIQEAMRTCVGRPPHSLASFGFGGKLLFMKLRDPVTLHTSNGGQAVASGEAWMPGPVQVLKLSTYLPEVSSYAGPLMGGGASAKELNKWIDERVSTFSPYDSSRLLLGVLKVASQHYGKLRSLNANSGNSSMEEAGPEAALAKLLAGSGEEQSPYSRGAYRNPLALQGMPSEQQMQASAIEVKKLLVSGKRKDALKCAQEGELWGIALILARQLGEKFYSDTVMEMARRQYVGGSPLRTLSLLLAGQPAEVFAVPTLQPGNPLSSNAVATDLSKDGLEAMLDEWQENLAIMAANRTPGDDRVILHLGDRLWGVRREVAAAHVCYLVADVNLESYSGNARLCLIGADHCKYPRTYVSAEAIQRTEIYEYAKVLGNPQYVLPSFQAYKLVYAEMLVEAGKSAEALRYCNMVLKILKTAGRTPDVEACRLVATEMEDRLQKHMQDGHGFKLAPKVVKSFLSTMDWGISKIIGGPPPSAAVSDPFAYRPLENGGDHNGSTISHPGKSFGQRSGAPMVPSASISDSMERLPQEPNRVPSRSQSTPDFGWNSKQGEVEGKSGSSPRAAGFSRLGLGRLGSNILQKASGLWGSQTKMAKLGDVNKFYYDEKLKKWVEEGVGPTPEVAPPTPPPPTTTTFNSLGSSPQEESYTPPPAVTLKPGTPPMIPNSSNQYSNRRQSGVRSRYVDTFNKGGSTNPSKSVISSLMPPPRPGGSISSMPAMFVPAPVPSTTFSDNKNEMSNNYMNEASRIGNENTSLESTADTADSNFNMDGGGHPSTFVQPHPFIPKVASADNGLAYSSAESTYRDLVGGPPEYGGGHARAASWGGSSTSFQNTYSTGEEDSYRASIVGTDRFSEHPSVPAVASVSASSSTFTNFYPNSGRMSASLPLVPTAILSVEGNAIKDSTRNAVVQQLKGSHSVDSLGGEEMQEVEL